MNFIKKLKYAIRAFCVIMNGKSHFYVDNKIHSIIDYGIHLNDRTIDKLIQINNDLKPK